MAAIAFKEYIKMLPAVRQTPKKYLWTSFDQEADVLYVNFEKPSHATDSELTDDDMIIRRNGKKVVGITILNASNLK